MPKVCKNVKFPLWPVFLFATVTKRRLARRNISNKNELFRVLQEEWARIPMDTIQGLIESMPRQINAVIKTKGYLTKY